MARLSGEINESYRKIIESIIDIRTAKGLTQKEVALACGMSQQEYSRVEKLVHKTNLMMICAIADYLGYELDIVPKEKDTKQI